MGVAVIIVAAGSGVRAGGEQPKQYQTIGGKPVLRHSVEIFLAHPGISQIQVVIGAGQGDLCAEALKGLPVLPPVAGGAMRQASVRNGLEALELYAPEHVLIHDAARPFVSHELIARCIEGLKQHPALVPALPVSDTLKRAKGGRIEETVDREQLYAVQTPQCFAFAAILAAHRAAEQQSIAGLTDDAAVAEWAGIPVAIIAGEASNRKLTSAADIVEANEVLNRSVYNGLPDIRVGQGFDVHGFESGDHVTLCGVRIPHNAKLQGHSDADVAMHALTDAILGAIGAGDIGQHFPPSDPQWKGAPSSIFLKKAVDLVAARGGRIGNIDVTIVCEAPRIGPHVAAMQRVLGPLLQLEADHISIKATTSEKLGFTGRREGIVAMATATVRLPG